MFAQICFRKVRWTYNSTEILKSLSFGVGKISTKFANHAWSSSSYSQLFTTDIAFVNLIRVNIQYVSDSMDHMKSITQGNRKGPFYIQFLENRDKNINCTTHSH